MARDDLWLQQLLDDTWDKYFAEVPQDNIVRIVFGKRAKRQLGSIRLDRRDPTVSIITLNGLFRSAEIPEFIAQEEMDVFVRVNVPVPADELCQRFKALRRLLVVELDGGNEEIAGLDVVGGKPFSCRERRNNIKHDVVRDQHCVVLFDQNTVKNISPIGYCYLPGEHEPLDGGFHLGHGSAKNDAG